MRPRAAQRPLLRRLGAAWPHVPLLAACALLLVHPHPPALDWPQHQAVGAILAALWRGDPCVAEHYTFVLQPTPYHLLYVVLAPAVALLGTRWGSACTLVAMAWATHWALIAWAQKMGRDTRVCLLSPLLFFSASFAWGFGPTMMGLGPCMMALAALVPVYQGRGRPCAQAARAGGWGALAVASHGIFLLALGVAALPLWRRSPQRAWRSAAVFGLVCALPAVPLLIAKVVGPGASPGHGLPELTFESAATGWNHLRLHFAAFDRGLCRNARQLFMVASLVTVLLKWRSLEKWERAVGWVACVYLAMVWLVPLNVALQPAPAWLLNVRFLPLAEGALWLLALPNRPRASSLHLVGMALCALIFMVGMGRVFTRMADAAAYIDVLQTVLPDGTVLPAGGAPQQFAQAWPPMDRHLTSCLVPHPVCVSYNLFVGGHFPIAYIVHETQEP